KLLYALANGAPIEKEELARVLWDAQYRPNVHDNALWTNLKRLRRLVSPAGLTIEVTEDGYRLAADARFLFISAKGPVA
ncbi:MAG TPA: hypothetical protein VKN99_08415, partial [Polyangia bacterium]|nr:hypothetical protein [Polyangia bacterium]